jgi:catechol 2,3-dioxygenase-like lactoylglutathione lyase family enzyme
MDGARMKLNQVTVPALDLARSITFYQTLGLKLIVKSPHYARFEVGDGADTFSLHLTEDASGAANGPHVYFECDDLDARVADLKAKGIAFDSGPVDQSWKWREAWLSDPAGVKLCLYWAGDMRRFPPWRLED